MAASGVVVLGGAGDDKLEIDFARGNPVPAGGLTYDGGSQATAAGDSLVLRGGKFESVSSPAATSSGSRPARAAA